MTTASLPSLVAIVLLQDSFWSKSAFRRFGRVALSFSYAYLGILIVLLALENYFLFPGRWDREWIDPPARLRVEDVTFVSADGNTIHAWWTAPADWTPERGAILYSHGNGGNLSMRGPSLERWPKETGRAILIYDYPGYGRSTGKPTEASCYASAESAHRWLVESKQIPESEIVLLGSSLGAAMAVELATHHRCRLLVLCAPFTSFPDMAQLRFPWLPARWLVTNQMDNRAKIGKLSCPVFISHGTADPVVPHWMGQKLYESANEPKRFYSIAEGSHVHPDDDEFYEQIRQLLDATAK